MLLSSYIFNMNISFNITLRTLKSLLIVLLNQMERTVYQIFDINSYHFVENCDLRSCYKFRVFQHKIKTKT